MDFVLAERRALPLDHDAADLEHVGAAARSQREPAFCSTTRTVRPSSWFRRSRISKISRTTIGARPRKARRASAAAGAASGRGRARASAARRRRASRPAGCSRSPARGRSSNTRRAASRPAVAPDVRAELQVLRGPSAPRSCRAPRGRARSRAARSPRARAAHAAARRSAASPLRRGRSPRSPSASWSFRLRSPRARRRLSPSSTASVDAVAAPPSGRSGVDVVEREQWAHRRAPPPRRGMPRSPPGSFCTSAGVPARSAGRSRGRRPGRRRP